MALQVDAMLAWLDDGVLFLITVIIFVLRPKKAAANALIPCRAAYPSFVLREGPARCSALGDPADIKDRRLAQGDAPHKVVLNAMARYGRRKNRLSRTTLSHMLVGLR